VPDDVNFKSDKWIPEIKTLCMDFLAKIKEYPGGRFLCFNDALGTKENPGSIVKEYHETAQKFKVEIYGENADLALINYHKIAALYIRSFLKYRLFYFDVPDETKYFDVCLYTKLANEYFVIAFLESIFRGWNNDFDGLLVLDPVYKDNFIKELYRYKKDIELFDPVSFSNTLFLIEQLYFHRAR